MMQWSRYNLLFESKRNGWLLYNSASNSFVSLEHDAAVMVMQTRDNPDNPDYSDNPDLYFKLRGGGFLMEEGQDDDMFRILKMRRLAASYAGNILVLTIAPTRECNFACKYCFEHNKTPTKMTDETEDKVIRFIEKHKAVNRVSVVWYGGEPLLEFERMKSLNKGIENTGKKYEATIVTNGYYLTLEVIKALDELRVSTIQITLDGTKETHDKRRFLIDGGPTFERIIENMDHLVQSDWKGSLQVRVNVDPENSKEFVDIYQFIENRYPEKFGKQVSVYPGFVHDDGNPDTNCYFDSGDKGRFLADLARNHGINALSIFPHMRMGGCTMTKRNAYVIGPEGELYKCWNEVGIEKAVIGKVDCFTDWNMPLVAKGMVQASYLEDEACEKCFFFPICDGGCAKMRLLNQRDNLKRDTCSYFKHHIKELLEIYYERKITE